MRNRMGTSTTRSTTWVVALLAVCGVWIGMRGEAAAPASAGQYAGTWAGSWEGGGDSGNFEITLKQGADGKITGSAKSMGGGGDYTAEMTTLSLENNKLNARYPYPINTQADIVLSGTFEGGVANGSWGLVPTGGDANAAMANGTWKVTKK